MTASLPILDRGNCEPLKAAVHGLSFGLVALMGLYNAAAWLRRRDRHLAINAVLYGCAMAWEHRLVSHHLAACRLGTCPDVQSARPIPLALKRVA